MEVTGKCKQPGLGKSGIQQVQKYVFPFLLWNINMKGILLCILWLLLSPLLPYQFIFCLSTKKLVKTVNCNYKNNFVYLDLIWKKTSWITQCIKGDMLIKITHYIRKQSEWIILVLNGYLCWKEDGKPLRSLWTARLLSESQIIS